jgi:hypothetical protein
MSQNVWATIMPFGPVTNFLLAQKKLFGQPKAGPHFRHCCIQQFYEGKALMYDSQNI